VFDFIDGGADNRARRNADPASRFGIVGVEAQDPPMVLD
jgi:hypothetical protein